MTDERPYNGMPPFEAESDTSYMAARSIEPVAARLQERVYREIAAQGGYGSTDDEIERALKLRHQTVSARRRELVLLGLVVKTDGRRRTSSGRTAGVYTVAPIAPPMQTVEPS